VNTSAEISGQGLRVLVAEDDEMNRKFILRLLEGRGFDVMLAADGRETIELARLRPDVILMDMHMPVMSGYEAARALKADPETAAIPIVSLTASAMKEDRDRAFAAGCDGFAAKPVKIDELFPEMRRVLAGRAVVAGVAARTGAEAAAPQVAPEGWSDEVMRELRDEYMAEFGATLAEFDALVARQDAAALGRLGHRLKGSGASYGFPEITALGAEIEALGKAGGLEAIKPRLGRLRGIHAEFMGATTARRATTDAHLPESRA
jgi:CheY-like chemotaxis protein/HPt (histidine-containing phosphotransfer) domain-containing protein